VIHCLTPHRQLTCQSVWCTPLHTFSNRDLQIDHFPNSTRYAPHETGTFKQRYFYDSTYYKPGGPVFLYLSGETAATDRFSNLVSGSKPPGPGR
jgi:hypothetical protein